MKFLITGATGLIGKELVDFLVKKNHTIHFLTTSKEKIINNYFLKGFYWNPKEQIIDEKCIEGVDVIIHLAGASISKRWTKSYKKELIDSRVQSSNLLFNLLKNNTHQVEHIISASGTAIYPESYESFYDENSTQIDTSFLSNVVIQWEQSIDQFKNIGIVVSKMRTGVVFSNKGGALLEMIKPIKMYVGSAFGDGKQMQSWIHIDDLIHAYYFVVENQIDGVVNAVAPESISNKNLTKTIASIIKRPLFLPKIPRFVMKLILGEMHFLLFSSKNILPTVLLKNGFQFQYSNAKTALENLLKK